MEFGQAFSYVFKDPEWFKKVALTALISLIPVIGQFYVMGWGLEITRRVITHDPDLLPGIDFGGFLGKGFKAFIVSFVYSLPMILFVLPIQLVAPIGVAVELDQETLGIVMIAVSVCCGGLALIYGILMAFLIPAAFGNLAAKGNIGDGLRFGEVFGLVKKAPVAYLLVLLGGLIGGFIAPLGSIACGIGVLLTTVYAATITAHLQGQAYKQAAGIL
ncbi:DUF4013 domain-containing protein [Levilinea saccharolytica]|uniref:DUF4013 domain-containing protein n=1 Tax=Levilinea saccharolytica TaxID=229921 RepID=A0A0P6X0M2_9CHLR|nr:DUF4013 domain-containing protein [Levilinea saccharolytica]KPL75775.1 hypothetical protein ADN01_18340 [Levilinea saccharolytica]GAP17458.1 hypothetical protein LSAC_01329 [Levilinea saccharolytica]